MYDFIPLSPTQLAPFKEFIPQNITERIASIPRDQKLIACGMYKQNTPHGICIASLDSYLNLLEIWHVEIKETSQFDAKLLAKLQEFGLREGAKTFSFIYPLNSPKTTIIEKMIAANHWKGSRPFLIRACFNPSTFNAPMMQLKYQYPRGYKEFLWKNLKEKHRMDLLYREKQGHFSRAFSPFRDENLIDPLYSLGLEFNGRVVAWLITHRMSPDTVRYSALYIEPSLKFKGLSIKLLVDSIRLLKQNPPPFAFIEIPYLHVQPSWIRFVEKRLLPYSLRIERLQQAWHLP